MRSRASGARISPNGAPGLSSGVAIWRTVSRIQEELPPEMVRYLVLEDADQPGRLGGISGERAAVLQGGEEGLLHQVFRSGPVPKAKHRESEQVVPVTIHPIRRI